MPETCTILTTEVNEFGREYHERMPVIMSGRAVDRWLDHSAKDVAALPPLPARSTAEPGPV